MNLRNPRRVSLPACPRGNSFRAGNFRGNRWHSTWKSQREIPLRTALPKHPAPQNEAEVRAQDEGGCSAWTRSGECAKKCVLATSCFTTCCPTTATSRKTKRNKPSDIASCTYLLKGSTFSFCPATISYRGEEWRADRTSPRLLQGLDNLPETLLPSFPVTCDSLHIIPRLLGTCHCLLFSALFFTCRSLAPPGPSGLRSCQIHGVANNLLHLHGVAKNLLHLHGVAFK